jgi:hypothetical protein
MDPGIFIHKYSALEEKPDSIIKIMSPNSHLWPELVNRQKEKVIDPDTHVER